MPLNKVFVNIQEQAIRHNVKVFRGLAAPKTKLFSVVKSNAYGHGIVAFSEIAAKAGVDGFCVDSVVEGQRLRKAGIKKPILVLGPTFKYLLEAAAKSRITITVSNEDALKELASSKYKPEFHLKVDTGMHRQGFYPEEVPAVIRKIKSGKLGDRFKGVYTHFASAKEMAYPTATEEQFKRFEKVLALLEKAGFTGLLRHAAASGGSLMNKRYHLDAIRIGIGLYGLWPSPELMAQLPKIKLKPVLSWHALVSEVKKLKKGDYVGYDLTEKIDEQTKMAVVPIGYWHGYPRALSGVGEVLIGGKKCRVLGRVSMDMIVVDASKAKVQRGARATLIGKQGGSEVSAYDLARKIGASHYEVITRINPLIERIIS